MSDDDLPITIRMSQISDHLNCPVCMCQLRNTATTPCGHRYCHACIKECVGRHHKCPVCNHPLQVKQLILDKTFDELINTINAESSKSETQYFDSLINAAQPSHTGESSTSRPEFSPVEVVLKQHLKQSLAVHERYYQELKRDFHRRLQQVDEELRQKKDRLYEMAGSATDIQQEMDSLTTEMEQQKAALHEEMTRCSQLVAEAYDRYLNKHVPDLNVLPVRVTLNILHKNILIEDVEIKPHDSLGEIRQVLYDRMEGKGDKVVKIGEDVKFLIFGPFSKRNQYEMVAMATDIIEHNATHGDVIILKENNRPVMELAMKNGSHIAVYGQIQCESDLPKRCFATEFKPNVATKVDYFTCKDCRFNWICRSCMDVCHKEHTVVPYIMGHQPTWACCYCPKKKKCSISAT